MSGTTAVATIVVLAGAGLVLQNAVMLSMAGLSGSVLIPLIFNSLVGLGLLAGLSVRESSGVDIAQLVCEFRWWFLVPGLLGTLFVLVSLKGYAAIGAGATIGLLVGGQLFAGLIFDAARAGQFPAFGSLVGSMLLVAGAVMIITGRSVQ